MARKKGYVDDMIDSLIGKGMLKRTKVKGQSFISITPIGYKELKKKRRK
jgi:hypothetical protein